MFWRSSTLPPPTALFFETNNVCNSRCKTCMKWTEPQAALEMLSVDRCLEIIDEFAEMSPRGRVSLCAAETLLTPERVFPLTRRCRALGLRNHVATNGSLIDELMAESLVLEGAGCVGLSLNSQRADVHDETRGRPGSFSEVTRAVRLLRAARERHGRDTRIHVHAILCEQNYRELEALHQFVLYELGADKLDLAVLQPTFALPAKVGQDRYFAENIVADEEALAETLVRCDRRFGLALNPLWIEQVKMYHRSIREHGDALRG
jgi:MoaA/NifB/PqqE/SkfB family radical SAM enzyme